MATYQDVVPAATQSPNYLSNLDRSGKLYQDLSESVRICQPHRFGPNRAKIEHVRARPTAMASQHIQHIQHIHTTHAYHLQRHIHFSIHPSQTTQYPLTPHSSLFVSSLNSDATARQAKQRDQPADQPAASFSPSSFYFLLSSCFSLPSFHFGNSLALSFSPPNARHRSALPSSSCTDANLALRTVPHNIDLFPSYSLYSSILPSSLPPLSKFP